MKDDSKKRDFPSAAALAMGRATQRLGREHKDKKLVSAGQSLEARAKQALQQGQPVLPKVN